MNETFKKFIRTSFLLSLILIPTILWANRQSIQDWSTLRNYTPSSEVQKLSSNTTMTAEGRKLFYVNRPSLENKQTFSQHCQNNEKTIVLGCYISNDGIYIYAITDKRLDGVKEVTSAHEMLHVAYERLSSSEKVRINAMLQKAFSQIKDPRILETVEQYRQKDPSVVNNELHSILGTEVGELPVDLTSYYGRYFINRSNVVEYSTKYEKTFSGLKDRVAIIDSDLQNLKVQIEGLEKELKTEAIIISQQKANMDRLISSNQTAQYNELVPGFNALINSYNRKVNEASRLIGQYNSSVKTRNELALEENELIKAIDSRPSTLNSQ